ncbi:IS110 family transposase [Bacteroides intestinalis]|jgi:hypothetical protein|uniref:IS110 family transposase n=1 Tax=Bacteroides intestinalis TaxID=329854 RepID=UPI0022E68415|nr:IS110 family transposase [Bacteroides intestinalis]
MDSRRIVAGLDVHKDSIYLCIMRQDEAILLQKTYGTLTPELHSMCEEMVSYGVEEAAMESTATYWMPVWGVLVKSMKLKLVNPYFIKQLPGRKSDVKDAQWIAECLLKNLIKASFVPEPVVQDMRKYNHRIFDLNEDMTYNTNKLDAALQRCGFRLSNYVSNVKGKSYQDCIQAISEGTVDPEELVRLVHSRTVNKHGRETIKAALTGEFHEADILLIRHYQETIRMIQRHVEECQRALTAMCNEHFPRQFKRLQTIPAVKERAASVLIAETGGDMKAFKKATHLVGWAGLKPRNDESNRKIKSNRTTYGNRFLRQILIEVAWVASRTRNCFFSNFSYVQCTQKRKNKMKIQVAIARKILVAAWHMLTNEEDFIDVYLKRLEKDAEVQQQILELESTVAS